MFELFRKRKPTHCYHVFLEPPGDGESMDHVVSNLELAQLLVEGYRIGSIAPAIPAFDGIVVTVA